MQIDPQEWQEHRSYLLAVAYRLLGSVTDAEDAVQEAYLRLRRYEADDIAETRAWLTTVVSRICLDQLRSARAQRESYVGPWLPEPLVGPDAQPDPADRAVLTESVQMAVLVVLESLSPAERTAFVLHDVFGLTFGEIAEVVGRSAAACRQLASRARAHVRSRSPRFEVGPGEHERVLSAFLAATGSGDLDGLVRVLDPDVVFRTDGGGAVPAARRPVHGQEAVARLLLGLARRYAGAELRITPVNGAPGVVMEKDGQVLAVAVLTVAGSRVIAVDTVVNPVKLRRLRTPGS